MHKRWRQALKKFRNQDRLFEMTNVLSALTTAENKGKLLELVVEDIFIDSKFSHVKRQKSGSQYGFDVIGYKENACWKAECKNLSKEATIKDISPKLVWYVDTTKVDCFVIVSVNGISNDLQHLLEQKCFSFPIQIWSGEYLIKLICESPKALKRLGIENSSSSEYKDAKPIIFPPHELEFNVVYSKGLPFSYDYFKTDNELIKAYTEVDFRLNATINNKTNRAFIIQEIKVKTLRFENTDGKRVLRQFKTKGNIEPLRINFIPKQYVEGEVQLNEGKLFEIKTNTTEYIEFKLSQKCEPGFYELIFEINCIDKSKTFSLFSPIFCLHKKTSKNDLASLCVVGKYYDTPVDNLLNLDEQNWTTIKKEYPSGIKYLGPTLTDISQRRENHKTWTINLLTGKKTKANGASYLDINPTKPSELLLDLNIPIDDHIHSLEDSFKNVYGIK